MGANLNMTRTPDCPLRVPKARHQWHEDVRLLARLQAWSRNTRTPGLLRERRTGWRVVDGRQSCPAQGVPPRPPSAVLRGLQRSSFTDNALPRRTHRAGWRLASRADASRRAASSATADEENGAWKFLQFGTSDRRTHRRHAQGQHGPPLAGARRGSGTSSSRMPARCMPSSTLELTFLQAAATKCRCSSTTSPRATVVQFGAYRTKRIDLADGTCGDGGTSVYDLMMAQYAVPRGLSKATTRTDYDDADAPYTPGVEPSATQASDQQGPDPVRTRVGEHCRAHQWQVHHHHRCGHQPLVPRQPHVPRGHPRAGSSAVAWVSTGADSPTTSAKRSSRPMESVGGDRLWQGLVSRCSPPERTLVALRSHGPVALREGVHGLPHRAASDQPEKAASRKGHTMDTQVRAVQQWVAALLSRNLIAVRFKLAEEAMEAGATDDAEHRPARRGWSSSRRRSEVRRSRTRMRPKRTWPRVWYIWRGNALLSSSKGHEYFLKHYLGTHHNDIATPSSLEGQRPSREVAWHEHAPLGKMDLVVDLNFRMDTSALYSDIVLPAATWYEKADLNSTDMHSFIHPLGTLRCRRVGSPSPTGPSSARSRRSFSETRGEALPRAGQGRHGSAAAPRHTGRDRSRARSRTGSTGEVEAIPGKTMPGYARSLHATTRTSTTNSSHSDPNDALERSLVRAWHAL